jgi:hypothetical protein
VVVVGVGVGYDELEQLAIVSRQPALDSLFDDQGDFSLTRTRVEQECLLVAEEQVDEWLLVVRAPGLAKNL